MASKRAFLDIEDVDKAKEYFNNLYGIAFNKHHSNRRAEVNDENMVEVATKSASCLTYPDRLDHVIKNLKARRFYFAETIENRIDQNYVHQMAINFLKGQRYFGEKTLRGARNVCDTMGKYIFLLDTRNGIINEL